MAYVYFPGSGGAVPVLETVEQILARIDDPKVRTARGYIQLTRRQHPGDDRTLTVHHQQITAVSPASFDNEEEHE